LDWYIIWYIAYTVDLARNNSCQGKAMKDVPDFVSKNGCVAVTVLGFMLTLVHLKERPLDA